jgi:hypothetical protein
MEGQGREEEGEVWRRISFEIEWPRMASKSAVLPLLLGPMNTNSGGSRLVFSLHERTRER